MSRIERTTPALVRFLPSNDFGSVRANNFSVGLYLPKAYQVRWTCQVLHWSLVVRLW